jgi:uncharacterized protein (DUF305 family)
MRVRHVAVGVLLSAAAAFSVQGNLGAQHQGHASPRGPSHELHASMQKGHEKMMQMKMTGDVDHDFAQMMMMHHQSGVEMADIELAKGGDEAMKAMARKIKESQEREIKEFKAWLSKHQPATR